MLGDKEAGKSTTLGWLATKGGIAVLTDDLAVMDGANMPADPLALSSDDFDGVGKRLIPSGEHGVFDGGRSDLARINAAQRRLQGCRHRDRRAQIRPDAVAVPVEKVADAQR